MCYIVRFQWGGQLIPNWVMTSQSSICSITSTFHIRINDHAKAFFHLWTGDNMIEWVWPAIKSINHYGHIVFTNPRYFKSWHFMFSSQYYPSPCAVFVVRSFDSTLISDGWIYETRYCIYDSLKFLSSRGSFSLWCGLRGLPCPLFNVIIVWTSL